MRHTVSSLFPGGNKAERYRTSDTLPTQRYRRIWFPGALYHLMHRGVRRTAIFEEEMDYQVMLELLKVSQTVSGA